MISSKRKTTLPGGEWDRGFYNSIFQDFLNENILKLFSRNTSLGAVFAESFNRTIRDLLEKTVFEKRDGKWIDILPTIAKQYNNSIHTSSDLTPKQASLKRGRLFLQKFVR